MRVKSLKLKNFQAHKDFEIQFSPYITTIKGRSDVGKSAILRALRWTLLNDFAGEDFIKAGTKEASAEVTMFIDRGHDELILTRRKGRLGVKNEYDLEGSIFKSFGMGVPDPIKRIAQVTDINFQGQHDAPFWFALTAGEVSRRLNAVIDLSIIDQTLSNIGSTARLASERERVCEDRLKTAQEQLTALAPMKERIAAFQDLKRKRVKYEELENRCHSLGAVLEDISTNNTVNLIQRHHDAGRVYDAASTIRQMAGHCNTLSRLVTTLEEKEKVQPPPDISPLTKLFVKIRNHRAQIAMLNGLLEEYAEKKAIADELKQVHEAACENYHKDTKGICPLCQQPLPA